MDPNREAQLLSRAFVTAAALGLLIVGALLAQAVSS